MKYPIKVKVCGMLLDRWQLKSCIADVGTGKDWATIYFIQSEIENKGHATQLMDKMKKHYEKQNKIFGCSVALHPAISHICKKLNIPEYN